MLFFYTLRHRSCLVAMNTIDILYTPDALLTSPRTPVNSILSLSLIPYVYGHMAYMGGDNFYSDDELGVDKWESNGLGVDEPGTHRYVSLVQIVTIFFALGSLQWFPK